jgi:hypothetical protein
MGRDFYLLPIQNDKPTALRKIKNVIIVLLNLKYPTQNPIANKEIGMIK